MNLTKNHHQSLEWINTELGSYIIKSEAEIINNILSNSNCKNILIIGEPCLVSIDDINFFTNNHIEYQAILFATTKMQLNTKNFINSHINRRLLYILSKYDQIPISNESIDLIILQHTLEMTAYPYELLEESYRILAPKGKIIIIGFKLLSILTVFRLIGQIFLINPWNSLWSNNLFSTIKLFNWLNILKFDDLKVKNYCYNLPINSKYWLKNFYFLEKIASMLSFIPSSVYTIQASKKLVAITPVKPKKWHDTELNDDGAELIKNILKHNTN